MCTGLQDSRFSSLGLPRRIWAVSAIHGELERLYALHDAMIGKIRAGDRIVYLGNYTGYSRRSRETIDELLTFRRMALSIPGVMPSDIVYLRGRQENMWQQLFNLQFERSPLRTMERMIEGGLDGTLESYGISAYDGMRSAREGVLAITRWTGRIREALRHNRGHDSLMTSYRRAAYTDGNDPNPLLFVNSSIDPQRNLQEQDDCFWNGGEDFAAMTKPYAPFTKVIRGYDPLHQGVRLNCVTASLDGGSGFGGSLVCAAMDAQGTIQEMMEA